MLATFTGTTSFDGSYTGNMHLTGGATLTGNGSISGTLTLDDGTILAPGHSPGDLKAGAEVWNGGAAFHFVINNAAGTDGGLGQNWNGTTISGALTINATSADPFTIDVASLEKSDNKPGTLSDFDPSQSYRWMFVSAGSISGFSASDFVFTDSNFTSFAAVTKDFSIERIGNDMFIDYGTPSAVPEPGTLTLAGLAAVCFALAAPAGGVSLIEIRVRKSASRFRSGDCAAQRGREKGDKSNYDVFSVLIGLIPFSRSLII